ncbi:MAG: GerAB/ArcD/ProY family transporter [Anaerotruncus sp.]|nr:GerAB/ArcD/ProY family transporter [Anaerotruncus sp.]
MPVKPRKISIWQLVLLLFISRFFSFMTYVPRAQQSMTGSTALLAIPLSAVCMAVAYLPFWLLCRYCGPDPLAAALRGCRPLGLGLTALLGLYSLYLAASTVSGFEFFITGSVYQNAPPWIFIFSLALAAAYGVRMGLEAFARMGTPVLILLLLAIGLLLATLGGEVRLLRISNPLYDGMGAVWQGALMLLINTTEYLPFFLLLCRTDGRSGGKAFFSWLAGVTLLAELLSVLLLSVLGSYAQTRLFPLHTAAVLAQGSVFGRLDLLHIITWVMVAFLRATLYLYCAAICLRQLFARVGLGSSALLCAAASILFSMLAGTGSGYWRALNSLWQMGVPFVLFTVLFPLLVLALPRARQTSAKKEACA